MPRGSGTSTELHRAWHSTGVVCSEDFLQSQGVIPVDRSLRAWLQSSLAGAAGNIGTSMLWEGDRWPCSPTPLLSPWYAVHPLHLLLYRQPHTSGRKELVQLRWWEHRVCSVPCSHLCIIWGVLVGWQPHLCRAGTRSPPCPSGWCCCSRSGAGRSSSCREPRPQGGFQAWLSARIPHSHPVLALGGGQVDMGWVTGGLQAK